MAVPPGWAVADHWTPLRHLEFVFFQNRIEKIKLEKVLKDGIGNRKNRKNSKNMEH